MTTSSTASSALTSILSSLTNNSTGSSGTSTSGALITTGQINVSQLVSQLMLIQSQPLTQLQGQESQVKSTLSAYGQEQSALSSLQTAATALALPSAFQAAGATVTGNGVSATVTGTPVNANYSVSVSNLAQSQSVYSASAPTTLGPGTLTIQTGAYTYDSTGKIVTGFTAGTAYQVSVTSSTSGTPSLSDVAAAINSQTSGAVNASVVTDSSGSRLVLSSANTGAANGFKVTNDDGTMSQLVYAADGKDTHGVSVTSALSLGQAASDANFTVNGLSLKSATNSVTTAISGVTLNLTQGPAAGGAPLTSQVQIATDPTAVTKSVNNFISAYNAVISLTNNLTSYNASTNTASVLTGDSATRNIVQTLQGIIGGKWSAAGSGQPSYLAQVGVSMNSDGTLSLNASQFQAALNANPSGVASMFATATGTGSQQGFANQISNGVQLMIGSSGALGSAEQNLQTRVTQMDSQQSLMQAQLAQTQANLTKIYSALNSEVSAAQAEQATLTNQLAALPG